MILIRTLFNRHWWWVTLLVVLGMGLLARLGIWQLDRLEQRRASNALVAAQLAADPLALDATTALPAPPVELRNRQVIASGVFDWSQQVTLVQQRWQNQLGGHLVAPLVLPGGEQAVLVDRGWIPAEMVESPETWAGVNEPGRVTVEGYAQPSQTVRGRSVIPDSPQREWFRVDIEAIEAQLPYDLLPIYILQAPPDAPSDTLPYRETPDLSLSEGTHMSYALQWFSFALMLGGGYLVYVYRATQAEAQRRLEVSVD